MRALALTLAVAVVGSKADVPRIMTAHTWFSPRSNRPPTTPTLRTAV